ncbi:MAG: NifU family protein [Pseudomonadota bacterium]
MTDTPDGKSYVPPFYTEEELDALYEKDPMEALRISRRQVMLQRELESRAPAAADAPPPSAEEVAEVLEKARRVLLRDGGDLELVGIEGTVVRVRLKGNCVGCPRSVIDLKHVVEKAVRQRFPQIRRVENTF